MQHLVPAPMTGQVMQHQGQGGPDPSATEQVLREQLIAAAGTAQQKRTHAGIQNVDSASQKYSLDPMAKQQMHRLQHALDPAITSPSGGIMNPLNPQMSSPMANPQSPDTPDRDGESKKGGRELSTSKRAAQNRAAQRAFRQRKEGHIKQLEEQVRDYKLLHDNFKVVQAENYQLREYIISLQSRLIEAQGDCPQPPSSVNLSQQRPDLQNSLAPSATTTAQQQQGQGQHTAMTAPMAGTSNSEAAGQGKGT